MFGIFWDFKAKKVVIYFVTILVVGPAREAGGFLGGHECYHAWEISQAIGREDGLVE